jgi:glycosyltransferase involved in cell wall biosynthesis
MAEASGIVERLRKTGPIRAKRRMRILLSSYRFAPDLGGIETVSEILAREFVAAGNEVWIVTRTEANDSEDRPFEVIRCPEVGELWQLVRWCDVLFQNNVSLWSLWPALVLSRPWIVVHQTWIARTDGSTGWQDILKRRLLRHGRTVSISRAVAKSVGRPGELVPNPYRDDVFRIIPGRTRERDLIFVGRLVSDKGVDLLLEALARLKYKGIRPRLTVIGSGPEETLLRRLAAELGLTSQVEFAGAKTGENLAEALNAHRILVVPSRWAEPFGVVALEAIACGCVVIGSEEGGLPDAMGPCGVTFPNGNVDSLADAIQTVLMNREMQQNLLACREQHMDRHRPKKIAGRYLTMMEDMLR